MFLADKFTRPILGHWYPCFGFLVTSPLGFKARVFCLLQIAEANAMYIASWDSNLSHDGPMLAPTSTLPEPWLRIKPMPYA